MGSWSHVVWISRAANHRRASSARLERLYSIRFILELFPIPMVGGWRLEVGMQCLPSLIARLGIWQRRGLRAGVAYRLVNTTDRVSEQTGSNQNTNVPRRVSPSCKISLAAAWGPDMPSRSSRLQCPAMSSYSSFQVLTRNPLAACDQAQFS